MNFDVRRDNAINRNRKAAACERRRLLRDQLRDFYLLIHRKKIGLRGGGLRRRLRRSCRNDEAQACRQRQNLSHANLLRVAQPTPSGVVCSGLLSSPATIIIVLFSFCSITAVASRTIERLQA